nr:MAG: Uma2 family endonuclease [Pseudomonadota bacterium]
MASAAERMPSFDELYRAIEALPPGLTGEILEPGVIRTMGRPGGKHRLTARGIARSLSGDDRWEGGTGWWLEQEAEIRIRDRLVVSGLAGWALPQGHAIPPPFVFVNPIVELPDWCCEVLSDSTRKIDRDIKVPLYAESGIEWIWLVDPDERCVEVLHVRNGRAELLERLEGAVQRTIAPFTSLVDTSRWWVEPPEAT